MEHLFQFKQRKTNRKTEMMAGLMTYCSMIYIVSVLTTMFVSTGMDDTVIFSAVLLASGIGCVIMGLFSNQPIAIAPSIGVTVLFITTICGRMGYSWMAGFCAVFLSGIISMILILTGARKYILEAIPNHLKSAVCGGIGCFLTFIGLKNSAIIVSDNQTLVTLGKIYDAEVFVTLFGIVFLLFLGIRGYKFFILKGMTATTVVGIIMGIFSGSEGLPSLPGKLFVPPQADLNFGMFAEGFGELFSSLNVVIIFLSILLIHFFETEEALYIVGLHTEHLNAEEKKETTERILIADALASVVGAVFGTPSMSCYPESKEGIDVGGRTGLASIVTGMLLLFSLFFQPVMDLMTKCVTSPILILVGGTMVYQFAKIEWKDPVEGLSAFATIIMMILTYSITDGIAFGFIIYGLTALFSGRYKEVTSLMWVMIGMFCIYFLLI